MYNIVIYKQQDVKMEPVVNTVLTDSQYEDLIEYFEEVETAHILYVTDNHTVIHVQNKYEVMEDSPLPDGVIVLDDKFYETGYIIVLVKAESQ